MLVFDVCFTCMMPVWQMHAVSGNINVNLSLMPLFCFPTLVARTYLKEVFLQSTHGPDESDEPGCCIAILG